MTAGAPSVRAHPGMRLAAWLTAILIGWLATLLALRVPFRCDLYVWSESPFMTDMLKLARGNSIYGPPSDVNSFVYAPGLHYLTYALLAPFGVALDVRWCRVVVILVGVAAAATIATVTTGVARRLPADVPGSRSFPFAAGVAALLIFANYTADVPHPDNLHMLHAALTLLLCVAALRRESFFHAVAAMAVAGLGVLAKQPAALSAVGAAGALLSGRRWGRGRALTLLGVGAASTALALVPVLGTSDARLFSLELPTGQGLSPTKVFRLLSDLGRGHRAVLTLLVVPCVLDLLRHGGAEGRRLVRVWGWLGAVTVLPTLLPYFKSAGAWNNLSLMMLWFLVPIWLVLGGRWHDPDGERALPTTAALRATVLVVLLVALVPTELPPSPAAVEYCDRLIASVGADLRAGRHVLLAHGTTPLIANGVREAPLDRQNTMLEMTLAGRLDLMAAARDRLATWQYDRVYVTGKGFVAISPILERYYRVTERFPAPEATALAMMLPFEWGSRYWQTYAAALNVWEPTDDVSVQDDPGFEGRRRLFMRKLSRLRRHPTQPRAQPAAPP